LFLIFYSISLSLVEEFSSVEECETGETSRPSGWAVSSRISELPVMNDSCNSIMHVILEKREALFLLWWIFDKMAYGSQNVKY
jgi:hypothetical protein